MKQYERKVESLKTKLGEKDKELSVRERKLEESKELLRTREEEHEGRVSVGVRVCREMCAGVREGECGCEGV